MEATIRRLQEELDLHEPGERAHADRVAVYAVAVGERMGLPDGDLLTLRRAAQLHDVGKMAVSQAVLRKLGRLTDEELAALKRHAEAAVEMLADFGELAGAVPMIRSHHERWDGTGYPKGLAGEGIPMGARILGAAEAFDVMRTGTLWQEPLSREAAVAEMRRCAGSQFDPAVVEALAAVEALIQPLGEPV